MSPTGGAPSARFPAHLGRSRMLYPPPPMTQEAPYIPCSFDMCLQKPPPPVNNHSIYECEQSITAEEEQVTLMGRQ